jgi:hypothetical protein
MSATLRRKCCCGVCCNSDCILATFIDWPAYRIGSLPTVIDPLAFLAGEWKLQRIAACHFIYDCAIDETIGGVHYQRFTLDAYVSQHVDGTMFILSFVGYLQPDTGSAADVIYIIPPDTDLDAPATGCDQTVTAHLADYPSAELTVAYARGADCTDDDCVGPDGCTLCCPDITCAHMLVSYTVAYSPFAGGTTVTYDFDFPMDRGTPSDCWYDGSCFDPDTGARLYEATAHIVCDDDGDPQVLHLGFNDIQHEIALLVNTPTGTTCGGTITPAPDFTFFNTTNILSVTGISISMELKDFCDQVENCTSTPLPDECPEDCFNCEDGDCGERCWFGSSITSTYEIATLECGTCTGGLEGCGNCCATDCEHDENGDIIDTACSRILATDEQDCYDNGGTCWWCSEDCVEDGGGTSSPCSRIDFSGSVHMDFTTIAGDEIHFGATVGPIVFDVWYKCSVGRWFAQVTVNGQCVFTGDINGGCDFFPGIPSLGGTDSGLPGSDCEMGGGLGGSAVTFGSYVCPA